MTNAQTKRLLNKLFLFRCRYRNTGLFIDKVIKDIDAKILILPPKLYESYKAEVIRKYGNQIRKGWLQDELNRELDGILTWLHTDFPYFTKQDECVFCYSAAGFPDSLIARLSGISSAKRVSTIRGQLFNLVLNTDKERRLVYLTMLSVKKSKELAAFPDNHFFC